jgi:hypothetical protein
MAVTAAQAKNSFGAICAQAKRAPIFIEKDVRLDTVVLSIQQFNALKNSGVDQSAEARKNGFDKRYSTWLKEQNTRFDLHGLWCDDVRTW